ncbi:UBA-like_superfamily [Hexamita inflata]|uniref:UBA-like superfamily n=1 Tax=Hexamita inflata TaxID=28002 RepID=A0AA86NDC1_9EUKA|nr:UBA-like superfamily [Hexamita inflata]
MTYFTQKQNIDKFIEVTNCSQTQAAKYLSSNNQNVERAINSYLESGKNVDCNKLQQPVQKENKQVKSFFNGANNQVKFQEIMNVSFDIANKYINAAGGDYDRAVQQYQEDQVQQEQIEILMQNSINKLQQEMETYYQTNQGNDDQPQKLKNEEQP